MRTATEIHAQLITAGILPRVVFFEPHGDEDTTLRGRVDLAVLEQLRADPRFLEGNWHYLHAAYVGEPRTEFRAVRGVLAPKSSLQFVVNYEDGRFETDVDGWNTQDLVNIFAHLGAEVIGPKIKGWFTRKKKGDANAALKA